MNIDDLVNFVASYEPLLRIQSPDKKVLAAMRRVDRRIFVPPYSGELPWEVELVVSSVLRDQYHLNPDSVPLEQIPYLNIALPIGQDQTCSQPSVVALMASLLQLQLGMRVLEVGTGCGYNAAIIAEIVGLSGQVTSIERIAPLADLARQNLSTHFGREYEQRVTIVHGDGSQGHMERAPYDRVIFTAGIQRDRFDATTIIEQCPDGIHVYAQHMGPMVVERYRERKMERQDTFGNFGFVPLRKGIDQG